MNKFLLRLLVMVVACNGFAQSITKRDSLLGGLSTERTAFNVMRYDLNIKIDPNEKFISGYNDITFSLLTKSKTIQLDLFENMKVDSILFAEKALKYDREFGAVFLTIPKEFEVNKPYTIRFYYSGHPIAAPRAPWNGGFDWKKDINGNHWVGVAVQGTGASLWYPCKDSQSDEPENGSTIKVAVPTGLINVSNGRFAGSTDLQNGFTRWDWEIKNPINNYNITVNIGDYVHLHEQHNGLDLDYYVLRYNKEKALEHFQQVKPMMDCFESKFGTYPFASDSFKLVETPYLGMEHQSAVAYGNQYMYGYLGHDNTNTGIGMQFDFIIIHESAHEWFGNSITSQDIADMWIHESFTTYAEAVYVECRFGYQKAMEYIYGQSQNIRNDKPVIGDYLLNAKGSADMYMKGSVFINMLRNVVNDDQKWWALMLNFSTQFRHKIIDTQTVITFFNQETGLNLTPLFDQYLRTVNIPKLFLLVEDDKLVYYYENINPDFKLPVDVLIGDSTIRLSPTLKKQKKVVGDLKGADVNLLHQNQLIDVVLN